MRDDDRRIKQKTFTSLAQEEVIHLVLCAGRYGDKRANGGKRLTAQADIAVWDHGHSASHPYRHKLVELDQVTCGSDRTLWGAITDRATNNRIVAVVVVGKQTSQPVWRDNTVLVGNRHIRSLGVGNADVTRGRLMCLLVKSDNGYGGEVLTQTFGSPVG
jgi:hypothetical protein